VAISFICDQDPRTFWCLENLRVPSALGESWGSEDPWEPGNLWGPGTSRGPGTCGGPGTLWGPGILECLGNLGAWECLEAQEPLGNWGLVGPRDTWSLEMLGGSGTLGGLGTLGSLRTLGGQRTLGGPETL
jgi:hypothetical protein